jgi:hypothetical protein
MKINLHIQPAAKKTEFVGRYDENALKIKLAAPPVDGKANKELISFLSKKLKVGKSEIKIVFGEKGRSKILELPFESTIDEIIDLLSK